MNRYQYLGLSLLSGVGSVTLAIWGITYPIYAGVNIAPAQLRPSLTFIIAVYLTAVAWWSKVLYRLSRTHYSHFFS